MVVLDSSRMEVTEERGGTSPVSSLRPSEWKVTQPGIPNVRRSLGSQSLGRGCDQYPDLGLDLESLRDRESRHK